MDKRRSTVTLVVTALFVAAAVASLALGARPNLGLDLQGGISAVYIAQLPDDEPVPDDFEEILDETVDVIRDRVDSLGVVEPEISRQGEDILVQLPGVDDAERVRELIGTTAQLSFRPVRGILAPGEEGYDEGPDCTAPVDEREELGAEEEGLLCGAPPDADDPAAEAAPPVEKYVVGPVALTGDSITDARAQLADQGFAAGIQFDGPGGDAFAQITGELACERDQGQPGLLGIVLDGVVESAPTMNPGVACGVGITGGEGQITVTGGEEEAQDLALVLRAGALPITLEAATFETVSPTLGADSLQSGLLAGGIGLLLVSIWMLFFYRWLGVVALSALAIFGVVLGAIIAGLGELIGFSLTLAGIAGIIVSIGITADSSVLFFERIREEVNLGKTPRTSVRKAFTSAFRTNLAGNTVTLTAAVVLYFLAVGPVRGFALMLGISTVLDLLILGLFTRPTVELMGNTKLLSRRNLRAVETQPAAAGGAR